MLKTKVLLCYNNILRAKTQIWVYLRLDGGVKKMTRPNEVFNILEKKIKTHVPLKVDGAREGCTGKLLYVLSSHIADYGSTGQGCQSCTWSAV